MESKTKIETNTYPGISLGKQKSGINFLLDSFENIHSAESNLPLTAFIDLEHWTWNHQKTLVSLGNSLSALFETQGFIFQNGFSTTDCRIKKCLRIAVSDHLNVLSQRCF